MRRLVVLLGLVACSQGKSAPVTPTRAASPISERMETFEMNGYTLAGAEYWPYIGKEDIKYPDDVLWGFYPEKGVIAPGEDTPNLDDANPDAIDCAEHSFAALQVFLAKNPPQLREIIDRGAAQGFVPRFYLWTNDYSKAATPYPPGVREAKLWYWKRKTPEPPKPPGYWKWEATLTQNGECQIPDAEQIQSYLSETLGKL